MIAVSKRYRRVVRPGGLVIGAGALYVVNPNVTRVPLCPLHAVTGLWCPFCGSTRAGYALLHGDIATAARDNAFIVLALPLLLVISARWLAGRQPWPVFAGLPRSLRWFGIAALLLFAILRNLPFAADLAPPS